MLSRVTARSWARGSRPQMSVSLVEDRDRRGYQTQSGRVFGYHPEKHREAAKSLRESITKDGDGVLSAQVMQARASQPNAYRLVEAYRRNGYKYANLNPVPVPGRDVDQPEELNPALYGLETPSDKLQGYGLLADASAESSLSLTELAVLLNSTYCGTMSIEAHYIDSIHEQEWLYSEFEHIQSQEISADTQKRVAEDMLKSQAFDNFLATKFGNVKRYGGEGAEAAMAFYTELLSKASSDNVKDIVLGMAHRGRLNLLTCLLGVPAVELFRKMRGLPEFPPDQYGVGDVLSHLTASLDIDGVHVTMLPNPSHLEAVNPVAVGKARAKHMVTGRGDYGDEGRMGDDVVCVQIHGDAALIGQGINQETLQLAGVPHYSVGGSLHLVINNQVGFTTPGERGRSSRHCTDLAKQIGAPVFHVNGDNPEDLVRATRLAMKYRAAFRKDIFINVICFRQWGHNELDDPTFTNPALYSVIRGRAASVPDAYFNKLVDEGVCKPEDKAQIVSSFNAQLNDDFSRIESYQPQRKNLKGLWSSMTEPNRQGHVTEWDTGVSPDVLKYVGARSVNFPDNFNVHSHLAKHHVDSRIKKVESGEGIEWGTAEALAIGSLLYQGHNVRISGQDVGRATFSHRHAMLVDQVTNEIYIPMNSMIPDQKGKLEVANSTLSEEAILGFEYGMSVESPNNLVIWEAQFGDFFNGAQIMLDTFVSSGESKWGLQSGLVLLLPHGMDGAGPEHSSCRMERFLQMSDSREGLTPTGDGDSVNWEVVFPTTAAQYFHLLRRQQIRNYRKPLVVVAPKVLLRLPAAAASLKDLGPGNTFQTVLGDPRHKEADKNKDVERVIFVSGRHYYTLEKHLAEAGGQLAAKTALVRLESLCPFPAARLQEEAARYPSARAWVWSQEEHKNMGAWSFVSPRFENQVGLKLSYAGREELAQPAVGVGKIHQAELSSLMQQTFS